MPSPQELSAQGGSAIELASYKNVEALCEEVSCRKPEIRFTRRTPPLPGAKHRRIRNLVGDAAGNSG